MTGWQKPVQVEPWRQHAARQPARQAGLRFGQAELLRLGENAIYALAAEQTVVRVARSDTEETLRKVQKERSAMIGGHGTINARPVPACGYGRRSEFDQGAGAWQQ
ncbi:hypothetical protein ABT187_36540 [Streptomyces sp. NPDC001817]|uniref:hypothetical protein n=1 Tax=Streptomyces sp. NPDC001817 TaxID=3154398 RepID=UPI00332006CD